MMIVNRIAASLLGGYAFCWGITAFGIAAFVALGADFHEAETGMMMVALLLYVVVFLWAFSAANMKRVWSVLGGGGVLMMTIAWCIQYFLVSVE